MNRFIVPALAVLYHWSLPAAAQDVVILGEIHDNPHHHATQAARVAALAPAAIVFEMLSPAQAALVTAERLPDQEALEAALDWDQSGWPDFAMYYPIFTAAPARIYGAAIPREAARNAMSAGLAQAFGDQAELYGLTTPLDPAEQAAREDLQAEAHCNALPPDMLAPMVDIQRLRDAALARATLQAFAETGGPVAVITGNGHARRDWGMPAVLARAAPGLDIHVLGQTEDDAPLEGDFDEVLSSPEQPRPDPCLAFQ